MTGGFFALRHLGSCNCPINFPKKPSDSGLDYCDSADWLSSESIQINSTEWRNWATTEVTADLGLQAVGVLCILLPDGSNFHGQHQGLDKLYYSSPGFWIIKRSRYCRNHLFLTLRCMLVLIFDFFISHHITTMSRCCKRHKEIFKMLHFFLRVSYLFRKVRC